MGLNLKLKGIVSPNPFKLLYKTGATAGNESVVTTGYTYYPNSGTTYQASSDGSYYNANPIVFSGASYNTQYWFKILDTVTGGYVIENIYTNHQEVYDNCINCCLFSGGTSTYIAPTPTPTSTSTPISCVFEGGSSEYNVIITPTPTATPTPTSSASGTPTSTPTSTSTGTPTVTTTPTSTGNIITATASGFMGPCIGGTIDDHMGASVYLTNSVTVDTLFNVTVYYKMPSDTCGANIANGSYQYSFQVLVSNGSISGTINECINGQYIGTGANICGACVTGSDNTVDTITFNNPLGC